MDQGQGGPQVSAGFAPPPLPVYDQPPPPGPDFLWQPGYWAWDNYNGDYYWVPGAWVEAPQPGLLWTPAWWGWQGGIFLFHQGYWGAHVGWYGGVAYGFGYGGRGFEGGRWQGGHYFYNRSVTNITNVHITNVYQAPVTNVSSGHASFNGPGGIAAQPTSRELAYQNQARFAPTSAQTQNARAAMAQPQFRASQNNGAPPVAAVSRPGQFQGPGVVGARSAGPGFRAFTPPSQPRNAGSGYQPPAYQPRNAPPSGNGPGGYQPQRYNNAPSGGARLPAPAQRAPSPGGQPPVQHNAAPQGYSPAPHYTPPPQQHAPPPKPPKGDEKHPPG